MLSKWLGRFFLWATGFESEGEKPDAESYVLIAAPHTTNWDLPVMLGLSYVFNMKISYLAKHTIFKGPFGRFFKWLGGIPIDRRSRNNSVSQAVDAFKKDDNLILAISPEGTRKLTHWKTGFYYIAKGAGVPIALGYIDYERKRGGFGPLLYPSGDVEADMRQIRDFYAPIKGKYPDQFAMPKVKQVDTSPPAIPKTEPAPIREGESKGNMGMATS